MQTTNSTSANVLANDLRDFLRFSESNRRDDAPASRTPPIGRSNPALRDLQHMTSSLSPLQAAVTGQVAEFYENSARPCTNAELGFQPVGGNSARMSALDHNTLARRASFLLNTEAIGSMPDLYDEIAPNAGIIGHSTATIAINAVVNSVKSQTELVNAAALEDARRGDRICPMTLKTEKFDAFLRQNADTLANIVTACGQSGPRRDRALQQHLEALAKDYFAKSHGYRGAPELLADQVKVNIDNAAQSQCKVGVFGKKTVTLNIDSASADAFCRRPIPSFDECEDFQTLFRAHLLQGFEQHSPAQKIAALYTLLMLHEAGEVQECMGTESANKSSHSQAARNAAARTIREFEYPGHPGVGDALHPTTGPMSQREAIIEPLAFIPDMDRQFQSKYCSPMITDARVRQWVHSTDYEFDLRALREPSGRLGYQALALNTQALLRTPAFRSR